MRLTTVTGDNGIYRSIRMKPDIARKLAAYARSEKCSVNAAVSRAILFAWEKKSNPRATEHASFMNNAVKTASAKTPSSTSLPAST